MNERITKKKDFCFFRLQSTYRKIPMISPEHIFVQKVFSGGLFKGELIFGGVYYWRKFCVSKRVELDNKNSLKHKDNSLRQLKQLPLQSMFFFFFFFFG